MDKKRDEAILESPLGLSWHVKVCGGKACMWFGDGWFDFVQGHGLQIGECLVLRNDGDMVFYVTVFESSACEKKLTAVKKDDKDHEEQRGMEDENKRPLLPMKQKDNGKEEDAFELIKDENVAGKCLWITKRQGMEYWPSPAEERKYLVNPSKSKSRLSYSTHSKLEIPHTIEKIVVHTLTHNFRSATEIVRTQLNFPIKPQHVLVKILYAGVNASDVNFSSGRYFSGNAKDVVSRLPLDAGLEV